MIIIINNTNKHVHTCINTHIMQCCNVTHVTNKSDTASSTSIILVQRLINIDVCIYIYIYT